MQVGQVRDDDDDEEVDHGDGAQDDHQQQEEHRKPSADRVPEKGFQGQSDLDKVIVACRKLGRALQS